MVMKTLKQVIIVLVLAALFLSSGCSQQSKPLPSQPETLPSQGESDDFAGTLSALNGIVNVERIEKSPENTDDSFVERYVVEFEQPISWTNPDLGTFRQRVFICYKGTSSINVFSCDGYCLRDYFVPDHFQTCDGNELSKHYDANYIQIEYRFFGKSVPEGLNNDSELYWEYLNSEEASKDFHHIITTLKTVLDGSTVFTGKSKGGYTTENMACYFPDDIDAYVSYVAPFCDGTDDERFYKNVYCSIGDLTYGEEEAKHHRDTVLDFEKLLLSEEYRKVIQKEFLEQFDGKDAALSTQITRDEAYEISVAEIGVDIWQYKQDFEELERCLDMPDADEKQRTEKIEAAKAIYFKHDPVDDVNLNSPLAPYNIQAYTEMGNYLCDLSYLRQSGAIVNTPPENDVSLGIRSFCPMLLNGKLHYSSAYKDKLLDFFRTTQKDIIKILGKSDTWYAVRMPETDNPHIHIFEVNNSHISTIEMLGENEKNECYGLIDGMLYDKVIVDMNESQTIPEAA